MPSFFQSTDLFGPGPHRFSLATQGEYILTLARIDPFQSGSSPIGPLELTVIVRGRLVASSESDLWTRRDAIAAKLTHPPQVGDLVDHHGRTFTDMSFVSFTPADRTDRGRVPSLTFEARFTRFAA